MLIGCCGWPEARARYFEDFPVVELQTTFYQPPSPELAEKWRSQAPPEFIFSLKAWQLITHAPSSPTYRRLKTPIPLSQRSAYGGFRPTAEVRTAWEHTLAIARALRAAVIVFQCPASFRQSAENRKNLATFFGSIEREGRLLAWEPRGDWEYRCSARPLPAPGPGALCRSLPHGTYLGTGGLFPPPRPRRLQLRLPIS